MKKFCAFVMSLFLCCGMCSRFPLYHAAAAADLEAALAWAVGIANDDSHGYSQTARSGPDYDCSSYVFFALQAGGFEVGSKPFNTRTMRGILCETGFQWLSWAESGGLSGLQRGDILLKEGEHTEFYLGDGKCAAAADKEHGILIEKFWGSSYWDGLLRRQAAPAETQPVQQTEPPGQLTIRYHVNGGTISGSTLYFADPTGLIFSRADNAPLETVWQSGCAFQFMDAAAFSLTKNGCRFLGWSLSSENAPVYGTNAPLLTVGDLYTNAAVINGTVTVYAQWEQPQTTAAAPAEIPPAAPKLCGDINADGKADSGDLSFIKGWLLGCPQAAALNLQAGDLNQDGILNAADLSLLKHQLLPDASAALSLNKSALTLNTAGSSKSYQLICSYAGTENAAWSSSDSSVAAVSPSGVVTALKDGSATVTAAVNGQSASCRITVKTAYTTAYSDWSAWSAEPVTADAQTEVRTELRSEKQLTGYHMDCYLTRMADSKQRQYRNVSAAGRYDELGLSAAYGEHHHSADFSAAEVKAAAVIRPGEKQGGTQSGINAANVSGYSLSFGGANLIFFITGENYETVNVTYYSARKLLRTPVVYENEKTEGT